MVAPAVQRQQEARDQTHVVVQRQPGCDRVARTKADRPRVGVHVPGDLPVREHHALSQARRAGAELQHGDAVRIGMQRLAECQRLDIRDFGGIDVDHRARQAGECCCNRFDIGGVGDQYPWLDLREHALIFRPVDDRILLGGRKRNDGRRRPDPHCAEEAKVDFRPVRQRDEYAVALLHAVLAQNLRPPAGFQQGIRIGILPRGSGAQHEQKRLERRVRGVGFETGKQVGRRFWRPAESGAKPECRRFDVFP